MKNELYNKLVDLYAGRELPFELEQELEDAATHDGDLALDMRSLRETVDVIQSTPGADFTEESYQRILMRLYARGADIQPKAQPPAHLQYYLPMQG